MGRRKIEIKAIKDDRNRSVTFLKRKGGLFKKAHELSVLCSVDVAVIIFGNNKKLYEYSSSDLGEILQRHSYYGGANEHKGPADFNGKGDDDDDDEVGSDHGPSHHGSVEPQMMPPHFQNQNPAFNHIRHHTPSASPPIPNGVFPHHPQHPQQRQHTPQPPQIGSRPSSRNDPRRPGLGQHMGPQGPHPPPQNGFAYMPNPAIYQPQNGPGMPPHPHAIPQHMQGPPHSMPHQGPPPPQYQYPAPPPQQHPQYQQQVQQIQIEEQRRSSAPPGFIKQERPPSRQTASPPQPQQLQQPQQPEPEQRQQPSPQQNLVAEPVKRMSIKSRSIFTPIDETRSILSQHWVPSTSNTEASNAELATSNRSQSVDVGAVSRNKPPSPPPPRPQTHIKNRVSMSSISSVPESGFTPPSRTNSAQLSAAGGKRPVLKVQIPDEPSDGGSATADSASPHDSTGQTGSLPTHRKNSGSHSSGVVLPPPSPSAGGTLLSAGASGPPNPFARPHPVSQPSQTSQGSNSNSNNMNIDTPVSALPSRFMTDQFLPSPSSFFNGSGWDFNRNGDSNTLASPLNFATPVVGSGPSFLREDSGERGPLAEKRKSPEGEGGDAKRAKIDT